jgi:glycosyltransferase involved in cell wall biosynthesis
VPRVSVIIPSYNHGKYIAETLNSILVQSFQDIEIVITDDGSTDNTVEEIKKFSDPRIRLFIFKENQGACVAANNCIRHSKGDYISMLSSDDIFLPDKLEKQVRFLDENKDYSAVFSQALIIDEDGTDFEEKGHFYYSIFDQANRTRYEWLNYFFFNGNCLCHPSMLIRAKCYEYLGYYNPRFAQLPDFDFYIRLCFRENIFILPEKLIKLRIRADGANVSSARSDSLIRHLFEFSTILNHFLNIRTKEICLKIFPGAEKYGTIQEDLIPYPIARSALEHDNPPHLLFGMQTLFNLFTDRQSCEKLNRHYRFKYIDFINLSGISDVFSISKIGHLETENRMLQSHTEYLETQNRKLQSHTEYLETQNRKLQSHTEYLETTKEDLNKRLMDIYNSRGWRLLSKGYQIRNSIFHPGRILKNLQRKE